MIEYKKLRNQAIRSAKKVLASPEYSFIALACVFGLLTIFLMPPLTGADEEAHFVRAYGISEGSVVVDRDEGVKMPVSYRETLGCLQVKEATAGVSYSYSYKEYSQQKRTTLECMRSVSDNKQKELVYAPAAGYSPATYIPQVIAIWIGKVLNVPIFVMSYMVRLAVLVSYIILIFVALRILPTRKWALVGIALLPHSIIQVTNPGADYMLLGATAIFIATIIRSVTLSKNEYTKQGNKLLIIAVVAAIFMVLTKGIFPGICFLPLLFFFGGLRKMLIHKLAIFLVICLVGLAWQKISLAAAVSPSSEGVNSILNFPGAFVRTMFYEWANTDFIYRYLGLGFNNLVGMPSVSITLMNILLAMYLFVEYSKDKILLRISAIEKRFMNISAIIISLAVIIGSFAALYVAASYLQNEPGIIKGVQARYFYPALLLLAVVPFRRVISTSLRFYSLAVVGGSTILLLAQTMAIVVRYW